MYVSLENTFCFLTTEINFQDKIKRTYFCNRDVKYAIEKML